MDVTFRAAAAEDGAQLAALKRRIWRETYGGIYPDELIDGFDEAGQARRFRERIAAGQEELYLICCGGQAVGYLCFGAPRYPLAGYESCLNDLGLLRAWQGRGLGSRAFYLAEWAMGGRFFNGCNAHNKPALAFYERMGGRIVKRDVGHANQREDQVYFAYGPEK